MEISEKLFWRLLEERGLKHLEHFWYDAEIRKYKKLPDLGSLPDFYIQKEESSLLVEVKEFQSQGPRERGMSSQTISTVALQKQFEEPFRKAKAQLKPYAQKLSVPTLVVFFDTNGTHLLERSVLEMLFGEATFVIEHDPVTGRGSDPVLQRCNGKQMSRSVGAYISAVGVIGFDLGEHFAAWVKGNDDVSPRIRILPNPYAELQAPLHFFNGSKDKIYSPTTETNSGEVSGVSIGH